MTTVTGYVGVGAGVGVWVGVGFQRCLRFLMGDYGTTRISLLAVYSNSYYAKCDLF